MSKTTLLDDTSLALQVCEYVPKKGTLRGAVPAINDLALPDVCHLAVHYGKCLQCAADALYTTGQTRDKTACVVNMTCGSCCLSITMRHPYKEFIDALERIRMVSKLRFDYAASLKVKAPKLLE